MKGLKTLPNTLTCIRISLIPFIAIAIHQNKTTLALVLLGTACLSDFLDGLFARKLNAVTPLGTVLDPTADKLFGMALFSMLMVRDLCPVWFLALLISINALQLVAFLFAHGSPTRRTSIRTLVLGKWNTSLQFFWICLLVLSFLVPKAIPTPSPLAVDSVYVILGLLQIVVFFRYVLVYRHVLLLAFRALSAVNS